MVLYNIDEQLEREQSSIQAVVAQRMSGVLVAVASESRSDVSALLAARIPVVIVDRRLHDYTGEAVLVDNTLGGRMAAEHLLAQGYRRVACIAGPPDVSTTEDRPLGFCGALEAAGHRLAPAHLRRENLRTEGGHEGMLALLGGQDPPDAVFTTNGPTTARAYLANQELGLRIPHDVALVGVDDDQWTQMVSPSVTVVRQPVADIGRLAGAMLERRRQGHSGPGEQVALQPQLVVRQSTAGPGPRPAHHTLSPAKVAVRSRCLTLLLHGL